MQMLLVENIALTFVGDASALLAGFARVLIKIATAPIERIARASDVAGVLESRRTSRQGPSRCPFSLRGLNHLT